MTSRFDDNNIWWAGQDCTTPPEATGMVVASLPVFQDEWVAMDNNSQRWFELGTDEQCGQNEWWFAGEGYQGVYHLLWDQEIYGTNAHNFWLDRFQYPAGGNEYWEWKIDATPVFTMANGWYGTWTSAGVESYNNGIVMWYQDSSLQVAHSDQNFSLWNNWPLAIGTDNAPLCIDPIYASNVLDVAIGEGC